MVSLFDGYIVREELKTMIKIYPDFVRLYKFKAVYSFPRNDWGERMPTGYERKKRAKAKTTLTNDNKNLGRAKTKVIDMALCNNFDLFVTFTFNGSDKYAKKYGYAISNREDIDECKRKMGYWLTNQRNLHGKFSYLMVPEYHQDKKAIHFHGLFAGYNGTLKDSGKKQNGRNIYNIKSHRLGHNTAVKIDNIRKSANYISKYLTKEMPKFKGKQRYWCSNGLKRPLRIINPVLSTEDEKQFIEVFSDSEKDILEFAGQLPVGALNRMTNYGMLKKRTEHLYVANKFRDDTAWEYSQWH